MECHMHLDLYDADTKTRRPNEMGTSSKWVGKWKLKSCYYFVFFLLFLFVLLLFFLPENCFSFMELRSIFHQLHTSFFSKVVNHFSFSFEVTIFILLSYEPIFRAFIFICLSLYFALVPFFLTSLTFFYF